MLLIAQSLNLLAASVGPIPIPSVPTAIAMADGGGGPPVIIDRRKRKEPEDRRQPEQYKLRPIPLRLQYDLLLEEGLISDEEWLGILLLHGVDPITAGVT